MRDYLSEIKSRPIKELYLIGDEIREKIITTVAKNGGHLSSNLGMIEATIALHRVFDSPKDKLIFDVGHQSYAHKIITGRGQSFDTLRTFGGISGFPNRHESEHDVLNEGHSGTSISAALGIAEANKLAKNDNFVVAIIGDGSLTNGMVYEAINNCAKDDLRMIILINDNEMSISKSVGGLPKYLSRVRVSRGYFRLKRNAKRGFRIIPLVGKPFAKITAGIKNALRRAFVKNTFFEDLGLEYIGPVNGNNIKKLVMVLSEAKTRKGCTVVHIKTKKGYGYSYAENEPDKYHGVGSFNIESGADSTCGDTFSGHVGKRLLEMAREDEKICAVTAAMCDGTGLTPFASEIPNRFFDVGIAEEHAITFASGLSVSGMKPYVALYSTFAQRVFDQAFHDIAIQSLPFTLLLDRCGLVGGDGITHQGLYDYALFSSIPNTNIYSPETYSEVDTLLDLSKNSASFDIIRYPKGSEAKYESACKMEYDEGSMLYYSSNVKTAKKVIITYGRMTELACGVADTLDDTAVIKLLRLFPINQDKICELTLGKELVYVIDEGHESGGVGQRLKAIIGGCAKNVYVHAVDGFVEHGELEKLMESCHFTKSDVIDKIKSLTQ